MIENSTPVPNRLFTILEELTESQLKILLIIIRQTYGWIDGGDKTKRKEWDWVSRKQFVERAGLSTKSISSAIKSLEEQGIIETKSDYDSGFLKTFYKAKIEHNDDGSKFFPPTKTNQTKSNSENFSQKQIQTFKKELSEIGDFDKLMLLKQATKKIGQVSVPIKSENIEDYKSRYWEQNYNDEIGKEMTTDIPYVYWSDLHKEVKKLD